MNIGDKVVLSSEAYYETYKDMNWKEDVLVVTHIETDNEGCGPLYSFESDTFDHEITCSLYGHEVEIV